MPATGNVLPDGEEVITLVNLAEADETTSFVMGPYKSMNDVDIKREKGGLTPTTSDPNRDDADIYVPNVRDESSKELIAFAEELSELSANSRISQIAIWFENPTTTREDIEFVAGAGNKDAAAKFIQNTIMKNPSLEAILEVKLRVLYEPTDAEMAADKSPQAVKDLALKCAKVSRTTQIKEVKDWMEGVDTGKTSNADILWLATACTTTDAAGVFINKIIAQDPDLKKLMDYSMREIYNQPMLKLWQITPPLR